MCPGGFIIEWNGFATKSIVVNFALTDVRREGAYFDFSITPDLLIALGVVSLDSIACLNAKATISRAKIAYGLA